MPLTRLSLVLALSLSVPLAAAERRILLHASFASAKSGQERQPAPKRSRFVEPDFAALDHPPLKRNERAKITRNLTAALFDDTVVHIELGEVERNAVDAAVWTGKVEGDEASSVTIAVKDKAMVATISTLDARYLIEPTANGAHEAVELDSAAFPDESDPLLTVTAQSTAASEPVTATDAADFVDVLVVYTDDVRASYASTAAVQSQISSAVAASNTAYQNSGVTFRLRLAGTAEVAYNDAGALNTALSELTRTSDGVIDEVHALRNQYGADDVVMLVLNGGGSCGIAWVMSPPSSSFATSAFAVVANNCAVGNLSFPHELGHNFGLAHDRYVASGAPAYPYAYGYVDTLGQFRDIMAYANACGSCPRIQYFSSPNLTYLGRPLGVSYESSPSTSADNVRALNNVASTIANWRQSVIAAPAPPQATFTDDPLVTGTTRTKALHVAELRTAINNYRLWAGLAAYSWSTTVAAGGVITAAQVNELRTALTPALTAKSRTATYTDTLTAGTRIKAVHIQELRTYLK